MFKGLCEIKGALGQQITWTCGKTRFHFSLVISNLDLSKNLVIVPSSLNIVNFSLIRISFPDLLVEIALCLKKIWNICVLEARLEPFPFLYFALLERETLKETPERLAVSRQSLASARDSRETARCSGVSRQSLASLSPERENAEMRSAKFTILTWIIRIIPAWP